MVPKSGSDSSYYFSNPYSRASLIRANTLLGIPQVCHVGSLGIADFQNVSGDPPISFQRPFNLEERF